MAEERLIDDDLNRDRKYKIRKNADGEDELFIDETAEEDLAGGDVYEVPEFAVDDEEAAALTPSELAAREAERARVREEKRASAALRLENARKKLGADDFGGALSELAEAEKTDAGEGEIYLLKLLALTGRFTDFSRADECREAAEKLMNFGSESEISTLAPYREALEKYLYPEEERAAEMHKEVEEKKAVRRELFAADRKKWIIAFSLTFVPMVVCLVMSLSFIPIIFARKDSLNLILAIVFGALALILFVAVLVCSHKMWDAMKKLSLNEKNSSTALGREYEELKKNCESLNVVLALFK